MNDERSQLRLQAWLLVVGSVVGFAAVLILVFATTND